jgi:hypothetical protein
LTALPSALARLLLSFLPGRAIPSLLGVSHTARRLCAYLYELNLSSCNELVPLLLTMKYIQFLFSSGNNQLRRDLPLENLYL